ncbi:MAG: zf-HC2 domain-containing protein [Phycisphaerae bacterium]|nr:zf-HC2 domain-containing protein [Phycisphaerae bacterium]
MNCRHAQHLLDGYLDGELPASLRAEVHAHRLTCSECQRAMAVVEVAGDVIGSDPAAAPHISLSFTDRVMGAMKPAEEPRVARVVRFRRVAAFLGPIVSAAAVWMIAFAVLPQGNVGPDPTKLVDVTVMSEPRIAGAVSVSPAPTGSATIVDALAEGLLSSAWATWRDTERSTRDLATVGRLVFSSSAEPFSTPTQDDSDRSESGVLHQAESMLMKILAPTTEGEGIAEGPDVL